MRERIIQAIRAALEPCDEVLAFWEAGSRATGRADQWSDIDLMVLVRDGATEIAAARAVAGMESVSPIGRTFAVPQPAWHGHWQTFYQLRNADPLLLIDLCIMEESKPNRFLEPELHGTPSVIFDKAGAVAVAPHLTDSAAFAQRLRERLYALEAPAELMHGFVEKELMRGRAIDALHFYQGLVLGRLVEALRMRYSPWRYNFGYRYLNYDLPAHLAAEVQDLAYVGAPSELPAKKARALKLLRETLAELKALDLVAHLEAHR